MIKFNIFNKYFKKYIKNKNIDKNKLIKNQFYLFSAICIQLIFINYFFSYYLGIYSILFIVIITSAYGFFSLQKMKDNKEKFSYDFLISPPLMNLLLIFLLNAFHFDYFLYDFNIPKDNLLKSSGTIVDSSDYNNSSNSLIFVNVDDGYARLTQDYPSDIDVFSVKIINNRLDNTDISLPVDEKVDILYQNIEYGRNYKSSLIYDIRSKNNVYLNYDNAVTKYKNIQNKSLYLFILSMVLCTISTLLSIHFYIVSSRSN